VHRPTSFFSAEAWWLMVAKMIAMIANSVMNRGVDLMSSKVLCVCLFVVVVVLFLSCFEALADELNGRIFLKWCVWTIDVSLK